MVLEVFLVLQSGGQETKEQLGAEAGRMEVDAEVEGSALEDNAEEHQSEGISGSEKLKPLTTTSGWGSRMVIDGRDRLQVCGGQ
jgi:hypothetical protein